ncbi:NRAMP family divalent metal transporter [Mycolicibacterium aubagnense]|uniref:Divalent metal cation transporter n=1 Tax=Mycolicibacterium aubagnense TaxID=319707 RepID=A0ABM7I6F5_9MYCO|nr:divalent metal cation transporter [Mycolicibacterium aubagnense]BBX82131.1 hypothetical protein MAUB_00040 [Mycolicibacterium aubagnense]
MGHTVLNAAPWWQIVSVFVALVGLYLTYVGWVPARSQTASHQSARTAPDAARRMNPERAQPDVSSPAADLAIGPTDGPHAENPPPLIGPAVAPPGGPRTSLRARAVSAWRVLGPGFVTGSSDDDPSGIQTYSQTGAQFGYSQLWVAAWTYPFMAAIQEICGRIGMVTGRGLAAILREHYSRKVLFVAVSLLMVANVVNVGADLGAMAATGQLLVHAPFLAWLAVIVVISLVLQVFVPYPAYARF